jgi:long-chain fatty acid transport protein
MTKNSKLGLLFLTFLLVGTGRVFGAGSGAFRVELPDAGPMGKGNTSVGEANRPSSVYYNPAGMNQIKRSEISVGTTFLAPRVSYQPSSGDAVQMRPNNFLIPHVYAVTPLNEKLAFGLGATSYFGLTTEWAEDSPLRYNATKSEIVNQDIMLSASYQATDQWSFAVSADNDDSRASKNKKLLQTGGPDGNFQLKAKDNAWGYRLASMYKVTDKQQIGLMYRSRISHKYEGKGYLDNLNNNGNFYQTIFGGTAYETTLLEKLTLPQSVVVGYSFKPLSKWTFNIDVEWMDWSSIKKEAVVWKDETDPTRLAVLNTGNPAPRDWHSVWSQSVGAEYAATDHLRLRGGYYHHQSPIPQDTWDPNLPDSNSHGITTGFGYDITSSLTVDMAYSLLLYEPRKIDNTVGNVFGANVDGKYKQIMNMGLITLTYKF